MSRLLDNALTGLLGAIVAGGSACFIVAWYRTRKQHCYTCRRMDKAPRPPRVTAEQHYHFDCWEPKPAVTPDKGRS